MDPDSEFAQPAEMMVDKALLLLLGEGWCLTVMVGLSGSEDFVNEWQDGVSHGHLPGVANFPAIAFRLETVWVGGADLIGNSLRRPGLQEEPADFSPCVVRPPVIRAASANQDRRWLAL